MLVLTRGLEQSIHIGRDIVVRVLRLTDGSVRLGITAPAEIGIWRSELIQAWRSVTFGSCLRCGQAMELDDNGLLRRHAFRESGSICPGSGNAQGLGNSRRVVELPILREEGTKGASR